MLLVVYVVHVLDDEVVVACVDQVVPDLVQKLCVVMVLDVRVVVLVLLMGLAPSGIVVCLGVVLVVLLVLVVVDAADAADAETEVVLVVAVAVLAIHLVVLDDIGVDVVLPFFTTIL